MWKLAPLLFLLFSCALPGNFQSRYSEDLDRRNIRRIAVLPPAAKDDEPAVVLSNHIYSAMAAFPQWQIVSEREVREVVPDISKGTEAARAKKLGELVHADAVASGKVLRYRERVGEEWGVKSPASVSFVIDLWDVRRGDIVWSGRFEETQRPLSENIFALGGFAQRGARWLKAEELTLEGVKTAVAELHQILYRRQG